MQTHFAFIRPGTRMFDTAQRIRGQLAEDPHYQRIRERVIEGWSIRMRTLLTIKRGSDFNLSTVQISFEEKDDAAPLGFRCDSFFWRLDQPLTHYTFPNDPELLGVHRCYQRMLSNVTPRGQFSVVRYIAGRRLTFRHTDPALDSLSTIGKILPGSAAKTALARLQAINIAVKSQDFPFRVAPALRLVSEDGLFLQAELPGRPVVELLNATLCENYCRRVGMINACIHRLNILEAGSWSLNNHLLSVLGKVELLTHLWPEYGVDLVRASEVLKLFAPLGSQEQYVLCHGDFGWAQMLLDQDVWSIIDFDNIIKADPYLEIAKFVTDMRSQPLFRDYPEMLSDATDAYLGGYCDETSVALDPVKLDWYRLCAEISFMARAVKKDRLEIVDFADWIRTLRAVTKRLSESRHFAGTTCA